MASPQSYKIRNYRPADFDEYVSLQIETERIDRAGRGTSRELLRENLQRPLYNPEKDLFIAEASGRIVGFLNITAERVTRRVLLDCLVHPEHRQRGLARRLLEPATQRARELGATVMHLNVSEENTSGRDILSRLGFSVVRQFFEMNLNIADFKLPDTSGNASTPRQLQCGEEEILASVQNRCFADTWGFNPNTTAEIAYALNLSGASAADVVFIYDGERPAGYCWTKINCETSMETGAKKGRILMLGVDPDYRGRDIGRLVLEAGLSYLKDNGVGVVSLTVDSENQAACSLYQAAGFKVQARSLCYEKRID